MVAGESSEDCMYDEARRELIVLTARPVEILSTGTSRIDNVERYSNCG